MDENMRRFAAKFGVKAPKGSKITFVPKKYAGKRITFKGGVPRVWSGKTVSSLYFFDFFTPEWLAELDDMVEGDGDPESVQSFIEDEVRKYVNRLPPDATYSVVLATGDYSKGSTFGKAKLTEFLGDLFYRFIRSKGVSQLSDFSVGVNVIETRK